VDPSQVGSLFRNVGEDYSKILIEPEAASAIRGLTSESEAKALYTSGRNVIQGALKEDLVKALNPRGIIVEDVLLKDVKLPDELSKSIELKAKAEQDAARMEFVLQKERQEADRKAIEAQGIANFQQIVSQGISPNLLKWKGIEATERLAESPNAKLVLMGNTNEGLPVLFSAGGGFDDTNGTTKM
jgi:regulator of protease activity HflC (stomatin/prohibitin superfamily)